MTKLRGTIYVENFDSNSDAAALAVCRSYMDALAVDYELDIDVEARSGGSCFLEYFDENIEEYVEFDDNDVYADACASTTEADIAEAQAFIDEHGQYWRSKAAWFVYRN